MSWQHVIHSNGGTDVCSSAANHSCSAELCSAARAPTAEEMAAFPVWSASEARSTHVFGSTELVQSYVSSRRAALGTHVQHIGADPLFQMFSKLMADGMAVSPIAFDITRLRLLRHGRDPHRVLDDTDVRLAVEIYVFAQDATGQDAHDMHVRELTSEFSFRTDVINIVCRSARLHALTGVRSGRDLATDNLAS
eukprot:3101393-Prymnesium_polylepis.1